MHCRFYIVLHTGPDYIELNWTIADFNLLIDKCKCINYKMELRGVEPLTF